ncbi:MAG: hypothetical protein ACTMIA_15610 [Vibrio sp.]
MNVSIPPIVAVKNQWLYQQVDVEYPTPESLRGRARYQSLIEMQVIEPCQSSPVSLSGDDLYLVDFHRLTILFAMLQSQRVEGDVPQAELLEFFAQIILSKPCELYVGFCDGQPCAAAIVTEYHQEWLISDCVVTPNARFADQQDLINAIVTLKQSHSDGPEKLWLETSHC